MLFICIKIKNVAVALLVLLVVLTTNKNKKSSYVNNLVVVTPLEHEKSYKTPPHTNNLVVITPLEHEKSYKTPLCEQSCCYHALGTRKKFGAKKNSNFLIEVNDKKFLRPPQEIIQVFHTLMLYLFER